MHGADYEKFKAIRALDMTSKGAQPRIVANTAISLKSALMATMRISDGSQIPAGSETRNCDFARAEMTVSSNSAADR
jgi:hypothetical protein